MKLRSLLFFIIVGTLGSCSVQKRASWHLDRAVRLNPSLLKANDTVYITRIDTIIREKLILIPEGIDTIYETVHDTFYTHRTKIIVTKTDSSCIVKLKELEFQHKHNDTIIIRDTIPCPQNPTIIVNPKKAFREKMEDLLDHIFTFIIGGLFGIMIFNYVIRNRNEP